jgi:hypothetical protein
MARAAAIAAVAMCALMVGWVMQFKPLAARFVPPFPLNRPDAGTK